MSGIVGLFDEKCSVKEGKATLRRMVALLRYQSFYEEDLLFEQAGIYGSRPHRNAAQPELQPYTSQHVNVWLDGEIYNHDFFDVQI